MASVIDLSQIINGITSIINLSQIINGIISIAVVAVAVYAWKKRNIITGYLKDRLKHNTIFGALFLVLGITAIVYGYVVISASFQISNALNPNFLVTIFLSVLEVMALCAVGVLLMIFGGMLIDREKTVRVLQRIAERVSDNETEPEENIDVEESLEPD